MSNEADSTEEAAEEEGAPAESGTATERQESFWESFTRADMRVLVVTFIGTVAANVLTVMVVAVALILVRQPGIGRPTTHAVIALAVFVIVGTVVVGYVAISIRRKIPGDTVASQIFMAIVSLVLAGITSVFLLALLGWALGVK